MTEKFVISNYNIGLESLKEEVKKAKTVWISNASTDLLRRFKDSLEEASEIKIVMFPGEDTSDVLDDNIDYKEAMVKIVTLVKGKEVPSTSIILDEERFFTAFKDPTTERYVISEMLYDECTNCFREWYKLDWTPQGE